jgi:hypothetical protein
MTKFRCASETTQPQEEFLSGRVSNFVSTMAIGGVGGGLCPAAGFDP